MSHITVQDTYEILMINLSPKMEAETVLPIGDEDQRMTSRRRQTARQMINEVLHYQNMFEEKGLLILRKQKGTGSNQTSDRRFRATFGTSSIVCCRIWKLLQLEKASLKNMTPNHLLWGLILLKLYSSETVHSGMTGVDEKTFRKWSYFAIKRVADLHEVVVSNIL